MEKVKPQQQFESLCRSGTRSNSSNQCLTAHFYQEDVSRLIKPCIDVVRMLDDERHLLRLSRKMEWKEVEKFLSRMLSVLQLHDQGFSETKASATSRRNLCYSKTKRRHLVGKIRKQLLAKDSCGNNCLHLICYLKPSSSRILPLLFQVAQAADGLCLSLSRNDQASTALLVACSSRVGRSLIKTLLEHGDTSMETIMASDRKGNTPFTGLIQGYRLLSKIPSLRSRYVELETLNPSFFATRSVEQLVALGNQKDTCGQWDEERHGCFPMLWDSSTDLIYTAWCTTFPGKSCPSILHGAALVAPALPPLLTDVLLRFGVDLIDSETVAELVRLAIMSTRIALCNALLAPQYSTYDHQSLHFVQKLLRSRPLGSVALEQMFADLFLNAVNAGLTWNAYSVYDQTANGVERSDDDANSLTSSSSSQDVYLANDRQEFASNSLATQNCIEILDTHCISSGWLQELLTICPDALRVRDQTTSLFPFQLAAITKMKTKSSCESWQEEETSRFTDLYELDTIYNLLLASPDVVSMK